MPSSTSLPRCAAIVGPYLSGKTTLFEAMLLAAETISTKGDVRNGSAVGDQSEEAKKNGMSVELNIATTRYLGDEWTFIDTPGSIGFAQEARNAMKIADVAVVVCEPEVSKVLTLAPTLHYLAKNNIPHMIFVNKVDQANEPLREVMEALRQVVERPIVMRALPIKEDNEIVGFVDLVSERAWQYQVGGRVARVDLPTHLEDPKDIQREELVEALADFDDDLMMQFLEEMMPESDEIYDHLAKDLQEGFVVPIFFGSGLNDHGIVRLLKALRHEAPSPEATRDRLEIEEEGVFARVFKTWHKGHVGKMNVARVFNGEFKSGDVLDVSGDNTRIGSLFSLMGENRTKLTSATIGNVVAIARVSELTTGSIIGQKKDDREQWRNTLQSQYGVSIRAKKRADEVKLAGALHKICDEDPSLIATHDENQDLIIRGQGDIHIKIALEKVANQHRVVVQQGVPAIPYRETIKKTVQHHARHKKQSGGSGQFADIVFVLGPNSRGENFEFTNTVSGGTVPSRFIPAVEKGVLDYMDCGTLGFRVVDIKFELQDGKYHAVDSSDMAFKIAAGLGMREAMPRCQPVLLEPIYLVDVIIPSESTSKVQQIVSSHRGQIQGFLPRHGWPGWDVITVTMPQAEMARLILSLRAITQGVGFYTYKFDHLAELTGREAETVIAARKKYLEEK